MNDRVCRAWIAKDGVLSRGAVGNHQNFVERKRLVTSSATMKWRPRPYKEIRVSDTLLQLLEESQIGRASCREIEDYGQFLEVDWAGSGRRLNRLANRKSLAKSTEQLEIGLLGYGVATEHE